MFTIENVFNKDAMLRERNDARFTVAFDMDNTLFNESGGKPRPGIENALQLLANNKVKMVIWTNSKRQRAEDILKAGKISHYFYALIARESYMVVDIKEKKPDFYKKIQSAFPKEIEFQEKYDSGKNVSLLNYDVLIDDNPQVQREAAFWGNAYKVYVCESYWSGKSLRLPDQMDKIAMEIKKSARPGFFSRIFSR